MPRAGSTLVEQILSSHSLVEHFGLPDIPLPAFGAYPRGILDLTEAQRQEVGEEYLKRTSVQRRTTGHSSSTSCPITGCSFHFIHLTSPNAKIIDARRHPLGCCFSNYRQHFARQAFTRPRECGSLCQLCAADGHVDEVLPGRSSRPLRRMIHEPSAKLRLRTEFEPACLEFYKTERSSYREL
jgi:hypothetical protein